MQNENSQIRSLHF